MLNSTKWAQPEINDLIALLQDEKTERMGKDAEMARVAAVRTGNWRAIAEFEEVDVWTRPMVSNKINTAAEIKATQAGIMPTIICDIPDGRRTVKTSEAAAKRTKIAEAFASVSRLDLQQKGAADSMDWAGFVPMRVTYDWDLKTPLYEYLPPQNSYYRLHPKRYGFIEAFFNIEQHSLADLRVKYPHLNTDFNRITDGNRNIQKLDVVYYADDNWEIVFCYGTNAKNGGVVIAASPNPIGKINVNVRELKTKIGRYPRGTYDDEITPLMAKNKMAVLAMQTADDNVNGSFIMPSDVTSIPMGKRGIIYTNDPAGVKRMPMVDTSQLYNQMQLIDAELNEGTRIPQSQTGTFSPSIVTGQGVKAVDAPYSQDVADIQNSLADLGEWATAIAFEYAEFYGKNEEITIPAAYLGSEFDLTYKPKDDIAGIYNSVWRFGAIGGMNPQALIVSLLQLKQGELISNDTAMRESPLKINVDDEKRQIQVEALRSGFMQFLQGYAQALPNLALNGQDPADILLKIANVAQSVEKGKDLLESVKKEWTVKPPEPAAPAAVDPMDPTAQGGDGSGLPPGVNPDGTVSGVPSGMAGVNPGSKPDLLNTLATLGPGGAKLSASVSQRRATTA